MRNLPNITIWLCLLFGALTVSGQTSAVQLKLVMEDSVMKHVYGLEKCTLSFNSDHDSITIPVYVRGGKLEGRFNGSDWIALKTIDYVDVEAPYISIWKRNEKIVSNLNLYICYFTDPDYFKPFMRLGGRIELRYSVLIQDKLSQLPTRIYTTSTHITVPPASEEELKAFEYAVHKGYLFSSIFDAGELGSYRFYKSLNELSSLFPNSYIGMMAGCIVMQQDRWSIRDGTNEDPTAATRIQQLCGRVRVNANDFLREKANRYLNCHN